MCFSTYNPNTGWPGWIPHAPYPQLVVSYQPPPPLIFAPPPTMSTRHPPHCFRNDVYCPARDNPPVPPRSRRPRTPDRVARHEDTIIPPVVPRAPTPPHPYRPQPLPDRAPPVADPGVHSTSRVTIDPILAVPEQPLGRPRFEWDLADNPIRIVLDCCPETQRVHGIQRCDLAGAAVRDGARALERLVLVFAGLGEREPRAQIEVTHAHPATILGAVDEDVAWVTVHDVLFAMFQWLVSPIEEPEMDRLEDERYHAVVRAARARRARRGRDGQAATGTGGRARYLKIDYLGKRRRFMGIRLAREDGVPDGERLGEVFVVELGASE